jgi:hypothetical protein
MDLVERWKPLDQLVPALSDICIHPIRSAARYKTVP